MSIISEELELSDPNPDIHTLFDAFNKSYFRGRLTNKVELKWSPRMTVCAGVFTYDALRNGCPRLIQLSTPILALRSRRDLVEVLLHEMIHAYVNIVYGPEMDQEEHGPKFIEIMKRINRKAGTNITIYNDFEEEVSYFQSHWWGCTGAECQKPGSKYGIIMKTLNRAPGPRDEWWTEHKKICKGKFIKIREPDWKPSIFSPTASSSRSNCSRR